MDSPHRRSCCRHYAGWTMIKDMATQKCSKYALSTFFLFHAYLSSTKKIYDDGRTHIMSNFKKSELMTNLLGDCDCDVINWKSTFSEQIFAHISKGSCRIDRISAHSITLQVRCGITTLCMNFLRKAFYFKATHDDGYSTCDFLT